MVVVVEVDAASKLLFRVQELWRGHSDTLGYLPEGGFDEHARKKCILAAIGDDGSLMGYVLYRTTHRRQAAIAQLCVNPAARGKGVARRLFEAVKDRVSNSCDDLRVCCRRDFDAYSLWPAFGFVPVRELPGRKKGTTKTTFRYELNQLPLLAIIENRRPDDTMPVAIDANIFFDIDDDTGSTGREESKALQADWLEEFIELCVTDEILNEINRREDPAERARQRSRVEQFRLLPISKAHEDQIAAELQQQFPTWISDSAKSDIRQLAKTIAGRVTYFVTRDGRVRDQAVDLYERYSLVVVSPFELILRFDELRRDEEYRPKRFITIGLQTVKPRKPDDIDRIANLIHVGQPISEPRRRTLSRLRDILADPDRFATTCITANDGSFVAAYAIERPSPGVLRLPLFAVAGAGLGRTAACHFAEKLATIASAEGRNVVEVADEAGGERVEEALAGAGFSKEGNLWIKLVVPVVATAEEITAKIARIAAQHPETRSLVGRVTEHLQPGAESSTIRLEALAQVERALWPAKIIGTGLPCFIVPIQPRWAKDLFDTNFADRMLFGADPQLTMNPENAYYRASRPRVLSAPGRVLWYVSQDKAYHGSMAIRACSYVDEVAIAKPKDAFRRSQRLGVYTWKDVFKVANEDLEQEIMVFRFNKTELFKRPVAWKRVQEVLRKHIGKESQLMTAVEISETCFLDLYGLGIGEN
jgi:GNAT superfamily N-acetyltransferase